MNKGLTCVILQKCKQVYLLAKSLEVELQVKDYVHLWFWYVFQNCPSTSHLLI